MLLPSIICISKSQTGSIMPKHKYWKNLPKSFIYQREQVPDSGSVFAAALNNPDI